ncbi:MAG: hypothetical protein AAFO69_21695 [Bacteroidota bacterium]
MKLFDEKAEKTARLAVAISVFFVLFTLWYVNGRLGLLEICIATFTLLIEVGILYFVKWYANK